MYTFESRVRYSEIDHTGTMTVPSLINYFQDCSTFQSEDQGVGFETEREKKRAWLLSSWQVVINRSPRMGEKITVGTFAYEFKGLFGMRNFIMDDEAGNRLAYANSAWFYMDLEKGRPTRPDAQELKAYEIEPRLLMDYADRKISMPEDYKELEPFPVRKYHIDTNEHVNNCQYVQMALEVVPDIPGIQELRVEYKQAAVYGDMIYPRITIEKERVVAALCNGDGAPYAIVELLTKN